VKISIFESKIMSKSENIRFIVICNYPEKLIPALRSRCTEFQYPLLPEDDARAFLEHIAADEHLTFTPDGIKALLDLGIGDLRRSLNLMQTTSLATSVVNEATVYQCAGYPLPEEIKRQLQTLLNQPLEACVLALEELRNGRGLSLLDIVRELHGQMVLFEIKGMALANVIDRLAQIERRLADGWSGRIETVAIAATYQLFRKDFNTK
jgi:replication factor C subunit 3/5